MLQNICVRGVWHCSLLPQLPDGVLATTKPAVGAPARERGRDHALPVSLVG